MPCYNADRRAADEEYLEALEAQLAALQTAMISVTSSTTDSYRFDDGAGSQQVKYRNLKEMRFEMQNLKKEIDYYKRKLGGCLLINTRLRRRLYRHKEGFGY
jgi:primosomal protein N''